jgi:hypothetical protein
MMLTQVNSVMAVISSPARMALSFDRFSRIFKQGLRKAGRDLGATPKLADYQNCGFIRAGGLPEDKGVFAR